MSPLRVMARGYSVTLRPGDGVVVRQLSDVEIGDAILVRVPGPERRDPDTGKVRERLPEDCEEIDARVTGKRRRR